MQAPSSAERKRAKRVIDLTEPDQDEPERPREKQVSHVVEHHCPACIACVQCACSMQREALALLSGCLLCSSSAALLADYHRNGRHAPRMSSDVQGLCSALYRA